VQLSNCKELMAVEGHGTNTRAVLHSCILVGCVLRHIAVLMLAGRRRPSARSNLRFFGLHASSQANEASGTGRDMTNADPAQVLVYSMSAPRQ
jgi:hypothetical protein